MPMKNNREYRDMTLDIVKRDEAVEDPDQREMRVAGYASTFNEPYVLYSDDELVYREQVDANAFADTDMSDVIMQYDHEGRVFARISNNTLRVEPDKMSFGFIVSDDEETRSRAEDGRVDILRTITGVSKLFDVSAVSIPANNATSISVRNLTDGAIEQIRAERLEAERIETERRRAIVKAKAIMSGGNK